jgi:hypothetical protein
VLGASFEAFVQAAARTRTYRDEDCRLPDERDSPFVPA